MPTPAAAALATLPDAWDGRDCTAWLAERLGDAARQRRDMIAGLRDALAPLEPVLGAGAIRAALGAMAVTPREAFVCPLAADFAYLPRPVDIGLGQIMSHPLLVAAMAAAVAPADGAAPGAVLDLGTGSGYQAAVLARMARQVTSVEIIPGLAALAARRLARLGVGNVSVVAGDGGGDSRWPSESFDAIVIAAGAAEVPPGLLRALRIGGRLVMPLGATQADEVLVRVARTGAAAFARTGLMPARFVPLTGAGARQ